MTNFYLLNEAIPNGPIELINEGFAQLIKIKNEACYNDKFLKHDSIWEHEVVVNLFSDSSQKSKAILMFINQLQICQNRIGAKPDLDALCPKQCNGFLGIDFTGTLIPGFCQLTHQSHYLRFCKNCFSNLRLDEVNDLKNVLNYLYPNHFFENEALEDMFHWNLNDFDRYLKALELIEDIIYHPHTGGLGQTEILKNSKGLASKRINLEHRITYRFDKNSANIYRCRGHYN